jgi:hypothetical protein
LKRKISYEAKIALLAVFTSIGALCISAYQAYMQRLQTYASVMPNLMVYSSTNYNSEGPKGNSFELVLENKGVGPAQIDSVLYEFDHKQYKYMQDVIVNTLKVYDFGTNEPWKNRILSANERISIVTVLDSGAKALSEKFIQTKTPAPIKIQIMYSSIYGEKWRMNWSNSLNISSNVKID